MKTGHLHCKLIRELLDTCSVPDNTQLADRLHCSARDLERCFDELAEQHGVVLHPNSHRVWVIHPFSLAPTPFLVRAGDRCWWGNCAWCSLGIATLLWYGDYLRSDWRKRSTAEARAIFRDLGFSHPVWDLDSTSGRF